MVTSTMADDDMKCLTYDRNVKWIPVLSLEWSRR